MTTKQKSFVKGALILTIAGVLGRMLGALYRIPFNRIVGEEGAALYGLSYSLYSLLFALSTAGIPLAVSKMVAVYEERGAHGESVRLLKAAFLMLAGVGVVVALFVFTQAEWIARTVFNEPAAALSLRTLSPAMLFSCLMAVLRGYFQGHQQMVPTAISQILEQFFRVGVIFIALFLLAGQALPTIVAGASFGSAVGTMVGFAFLAVFFVYYYRHNHPANVVAPAQQESTAAMLKQLVVYAIPISIGSLVLSITQFVDSSMDIGCLEASGMAHAEALVQYGYLASYAMPIINLLFIVTSAISSSLVPTIANLYELKDAEGVQHNVRTSLLLTVIIMLPAAAGLATLGTPICDLLYDNAASGAALSYVAFAVVGIGIYQVSSGALQGMGRVYIPMASLLIGALLKIGLNYLLLSRPGADIRMAALSTVIAFAVAALHNLYQVGRIVGWKWFSLKQLVVKPVISTIAMVVCVMLVKFVFSDSAFLATACGVLVGVIAYFVVLFAIGGIDRDTLEKFPKIGPKLARKWGGK
ncbi:MAG: polysaccharide biosynthesis protein [Peptococcaceae bacterium]|nr:polysaccharide biosynthesis protein [Peptococcaceae bacterium]